MLRHREIYSFSLTRCLSLRSKTNASYFIYLLLNLNCLVYVRSRLLVAWRLLKSLTVLMQPGFRALWFQSFLCRIVQLVISLTLLVFTAWAHSNTSRSPNRCHGRRRLDDYFSPSRTKTSNFVNQTNLRCQHVGASLAEVAETGLERARVLETEWVPCQRLKSHSGAVQIGIRW